MKQLYLGDEAVARGLYEAGVRVVSAYPAPPAPKSPRPPSNTPKSTASGPPTRRWPLETACGASIGGARSFCAMSTWASTWRPTRCSPPPISGVNGGHGAVAVADDPGMHSSQNEQDSRYYARSAPRSPCWSPPTAPECREFTQAGL